MDKFLSCDWGTSAFRLRCIDTKSFSVLEEVSSEQGIANVYNQWKESGSDESGRIEFYLQVIRPHIDELQSRTGTSLVGVPVFMSGMASSTIGMKELPYAGVPFPINGSSAVVHEIAQATSFPHPCFLISGIKTDVDVMRGEETQLVGCIELPLEKPGNHLFIFPGTHSKHIVINGNHVTSFETYMTGEFFDLLSRKSILHASVEHEDIQYPGCLESFMNGVLMSIGSNLLHTAFITRTNQVFQKLNKKENYHFLSGVLIGSELQNVLTADPASISLYASPHLQRQYETALQALGMKENSIVHYLDTNDNAVVKGQYKIISQYLSQ